jgi:hypothetical protein
VSRKRPELPAPAFDIPGAFGILQELIGRVDAMTYATERHFERFGWRCRDEVDETDNPIGHLAHLISAARDASLSAVSAGRVIAEELAKRRCCMTDIATPLDELRIALGEVDTLAMLTRAAYDEADWGGSDPDIVERIACLLGLIEKSSSAAVVAFHRLHGAVVQPVEAGEQRAEGMSAEDAAIIRRNRTRCPDRRFDGGTDEELIELFRRNKQVLARSDEDVIAAMTRPR